MGLNILTQDHKFTNNVEFTDTVYISSLSTPKLESVYTTVNSNSAFKINDTISSDYTFSNSDNTNTYHVDTSSGVLSGIFPSTLSNNFSVNLILVSTNTFVVSSSQTPLLSSNGNKVNLPFSSVLIYKYNNILYGLGNFY